VRKSVERIMPFLFGILGLCLWQAAIWVTRTPAYILPGPIAIFNAYLGDYATLNAALLSTLIVTVAALIAATLLGVILALLMAASDLARAAIQPWAVILQVTPVVAIAPLIIIWVNQPFLALVLSNTAAGLAATPRELLDLFRLNGATRLQTLLLLRLPSALPYFLAGLRIAGTLSLVGAVVAEFVAGSGGFASGLAYRILEAGYRLEIARMFAAIYAALGLFSHLMLRRRDAA
jgi:NitT/TauT family transport system permease protein